jgi:RNA methyltransferase, TrmH family
MLSKNEIKYIQSLCHKKQRDETERFIAEGPKVAEELLQSTFEVVHVYATKAYIDKHEHFHFPVTEISEAELERISGLQTPNQVLVVAKQKQVQQSPVFKGQLSLVLDGIQDPGNMGTILRTADWFGINQIICTHDCVELYNPKVVQSTMGSITRVNVWYEDVAGVISNAAVPVYGALLNGQNVFEVGKIEEGILVIGNESKGIRDVIRQSITYPVTIPRIGGAESLNAAVASGIIMGAMRNAG